MDESQTRISNIKQFCCLCGAAIASNPLNQCDECLRASVDITEEIPKQCVLHSCNKCERWWQPSNAWIKAELESKTLMSVCLKRIKGLNKLTLIDAAFVWTEQHSKRIKVMLTVQRELNNAPIQQSTIVEFTILNKICDECQRGEAKDFWNVVIQTRQHVDHKKTFYFLEQMIIKMNMHKFTVNLKKAADGMDFYFSNQQDARRVMEFLETIVPLRYTTSKKLISHDTHKNTHNYQHTYSVEIVPICKDDVVCLPAELSREHGKIGPVCVCTHVTSLVHLIDPCSLRTLEVNANTYWRNPFCSLSTSKQLRQFLVMDIECMNRSDSKGKYTAADAWVMKSNDLGVSEQQYHTRTHLGNLLSPGDTALGFDLSSANINDPNYDLLDPHELPDVVLVKKTYTSESIPQKQKRLESANRDEADVDAEDYLEFLAEFEQDAKLQESVAILFDEMKKDEATAGIQE